jgi:hypothetical protein
VRSAGGRSLKFHAFKYVEGLKPSRAVRPTVPMAWAPCGEEFPRSLPRPDSPAAPTAPPTREANPVARSQDRRLNNPGNVILSNQNYLIGISKLKVCPLKSDSEGLRNPHASLFEHYLRVIYFAVSAPGPINWLLPMSWLTAALSGGSCTAILVAAREPVSGAGEMGPRQSARAPDWGREETQGVWPN